MSILYWNHWGRCYLAFVCSQWRIHTNDIPGGASIPVPLSLKAHVRNYLQETPVSDNGLECVW